MNPPFHLAGDEDRGLGLAFVTQAARALRRGGTCWMVANLALPYETHLAGLFRQVNRRATAAGFKVIEAIK